MDELGLPEDFEDVGQEVEQFANALDDCLSPLLTASEKRDRLLRLPQIYHRNATYRLGRLEAEHARKHRHDGDMDIDDSDAPRPSDAEAAQMDRFKKESQTWDLLARLLPLRYKGDATSSADCRLNFDEPGHDTLWGEFLRTEPTARERYEVVQWLQGNAQSGPDIDELVQELQQNADRGDVIAHGWLHTRSAIKLRKGVTAWPQLLDKQSPSIAQSHVNADGARLVTQLDPDATTRQDRKLEPQDAYFERAIWLGCFEHLRRGSSMDTIREWCQERTEMWRAISMSAMPLSNDQGDEPVLNAGPASLALWRRMCHSLSRNGGSDTYERAVYGVLSGDIASVEKVAATWDDVLFANYNALLRTQLDNFVLGRCSAAEASDLSKSFSSFDAMQFHGDESTVAKRLVSSLETRPDIAAQALEPNKALQGSIIANCVHEHLFEQGLAMTAAVTSTELLSLAPLKDSENEVDKRKFFYMHQHFGLRIVAHIYLVVTLLDSLEGQVATPSRPASKPNLAWAEENILAIYTAFLWNCGLKELIPLYCSVLPSPRREEVLSCSFIKEEEDDRRYELLKLVDKAGINKVDFLQTQAWLMYGNLDVKKNQAPAKPAFKILSEDPPSARYGRTIKSDFFGEDDVVEGKHLDLIRALQWLFTEQSNWPLAFSFGVKVYKYFFQNQHLSAARLLMEQVKYETYMSEYFGLEGADEFPQDISFWQEQIEESGTDGVTPQEAMSNARNFQGLEALVKALDSLETISSLVEISKDPGNGPLNTAPLWHKVVEEIRTTKENMQPLLQNWLIGGIQEDDTELRQIRQMYLPETVLAYVSALHFSGTTVSRDNLLESMDLATVIAGSDSDLADSFVKAGRMRELVESLTACSKALAVMTGEKRVMGVSSKKLREKGWSRDLWSVKS